MACKYLFVTSTFPLSTSPSFVRRKITNQKKEGGIILPDQANLFIAGIEDAEYKSEKIECKFHFHKLLISQSGITSMVITLDASRRWPTENLWLILLTSKL
jgi:hypothetical protein